MFQGKLVTTFLVGSEGMKWSLFLRRNSDLRVNEGCLQHLHLILKLLKDRVHALI